jgi:hypothetical protein
MIASVWWRGCNGGTPPRSVPAIVRQAKAHHLAVERRCAIDVMGVEHHVASPCRVLAGDARVGAKAKRG